MGAMRRQRGMTLIELIIGIVVVQIVALALYGALAMMTSRTASTRDQTQSLLLAQAYLDEIRGQAFASLAPESGCAPTRACFNDVLDYTALSTFDAPQDSLGQPLSGLEAYRVRVQPTLVDLEGVQAWHIQVWVQDPLGYEVSLSGWRTCHGEYDDLGNSRCGG